MAMKKKCVGMDGKLKKGWKFGKGGRCKKVARKVKAGHRRGHKRR